MRQPVSLTAAVAAATFAFVLSFSTSFGEPIARPKKSQDLINGPLITSKLRTNRTIIVCPSAKEDFTSIQDAIDSVPDGNSEWIIIHLRAGIYKEKVVVPKKKEYIFLRGNGKGRTSIVWDDSSYSNTESATFTVHADNFIAFGVSIKNDAPIGLADSAFNRSVAAMVGGDKVAFYHCAFYSPHNTLFDYDGRHYYESCYIQGNIDFIFGHAQSIFQSCEIFVLSDRRMGIHGSITAHNRQSEDEENGFVFLKGKVYGTSEVYLGRARSAYSRVVFIGTYLSKTIAPEGWTNWSYEGKTDGIFYGEYDCYGPGADTKERAPWTRKLTEEEAAKFRTIDFINGKEWLPAYY